MGKAGRRLGIEGTIGLDSEPWGWFGMLVCILLAAYALRASGLVSESLWIDEGYSLALAGHSLPEIVQGTAADQHPPFYYLVLWAWLGLGRTLFSLRYLSALIGTLGVAAGAWVGRELLGKRVGLVTGLLLACSPMHVWYSQEARMYILLALLVTLSAGLTWRLVHGRRGWLWYAVCTGLALYTHYFAGFVILAENVFVLAWLGLLGRRVKAIPSRRRFLWQWLGSQAALVLAFAPWLPVAVYQTRFHQMTWVAPPSMFKIAGTPLLMVLGDAGRGPLGVTTFVGLGAAVVWSVWKERQAGRRDVIRGYGFALGWLLVPFAAIALLSLAVPLFQGKQMLMLLPPLLILIAAALVRLPRLAQVVLVVALVGLVAGSLSTMYRAETKDGWREAGIYIQTRYRPGDVLYVNPAAGTLALDAYLAWTLPQEGYPPEYDVRSGGWEGEPVTAAGAEREMSTLVAAGYERTWLVEFGPEFWDPDGHLRAWLEGNAQSVSEQSFGRIEVRLYDLTRERIREIDRRGNSVSKHLIERLLERPQRGTKGWWLRVAVGAALLAVSLFFLGYVLYRGRETLWQTLQQVDWRLLGIAFMLYPLGLVPVNWAWHLLMSRTGGCSDWRTNVRLYCLSCLPKRIPSSVWYIASRVVLYRDQGVESALTLTATALEMIWLVLSGLSVYLLSLPFWGAVGETAQLDGRLIVVAGVGLALTLASPLWSPPLLRGVRWLLARMGITVSVQLEARDVLPLLGLSVLAWVGGGVVLYVLANAVTPVPLAQLPVLVGAWAASGAVSLSAGLLVSGMGLREVTLTVLLGNLVPLPVAVAISLLFRVLLMVGEVVWALVFAALAGGIRRITLKDY